MEVGQVLHMNGGTSNESYANNSLLQRKVISMTKPIIEEAMTKLFSRRCPTKLAIADLGCSSGPNTLLVISELTKTAKVICDASGSQLPEFQVFLNDLPGNDFNALFSSIQSFQDELRKQIGAGPCFLNGVPGSFYGRLFPCNTVHFFHSSYSLQWLSQVPGGVESNKGNISAASTSPPCVLKAYYEQFQRDFSSFLQCRSEELVADGGMVLTFLGRRGQDHSTKECCDIWELLGLALNNMVTAGVIEEEKINSFNIPQYTPSPDEIQKEVIKEGAFGIDRLEVSEVNWNGADADAADDGGYDVAMCMRAVAEPLLISHFGEAVIEEVFYRYRLIIADCMSKEKTTFINVTVSLTKIG